MFHGFSRLCYDMYLEISAVETPVACKDKELLIKPRKNVTSKALFRYLKFAIRRGQKAVMPPHAIHSQIPLTIVDQQFDRKKSKP